VSLDEIKISTQVVNGQEMYVPDAATWEILFHTGSFQGRALFAPDMRDLIRSHLDLAHRYPEFSLAFSGVSALKHFWIVCMLLKTPFGAQRVHIEYLTCPVCNWYGPTANPMVPDLYLGTTDRWGAMKNAERHPVLPCPKCNSKLPRHPVWVQPLADSNGGGVTGD
jgi:hypothetical protein